MATLTSFLTGKPTMQRLGGELVLAKQELDFSATNAAASDVVQAVNIPAGAFVLAVWIYINTAEGGVATADIGDGADPNGFDDAVNFNAAAGTVTKALQGTDAYAVGKYYSAADTVDIVPDNALDTAIVTVMVLYTLLESVS